MANALPASVRSDSAGPTLTWCWRKRRLIAPRRRATNVRSHLLTLSARTEPALCPLDRAVRATHRKSGSGSALPIFATRPMSAALILAHRLAVDGCQCGSHGGKTAGSLDRASRARGLRVVFVETSIVQRSRFCSPARAHNMSAWAERLYETSPTFARALDRCDAALREYLGPSLLDVLYPPDGAVLSNR